MMHEIKSIGVLQTSLVFGFVNFVLGVLTGLGHHPAMPLSMPIAYAFGGVLVSAMLCSTYNAAAKVIGGIQIELSNSQSRRG